MIKYVYEVADGTYPDSTSCNGFATNEKAIKEMILADEFIFNLGSKITEMKVDFKKMKVFYTFIDWGGDEDNGVFYLFKHKIFN